MEWEMIGIIRTKIRLAVFTLDLAACVLTWFISPTWKQLFIYTGIGVVYYFAGWLTRIAEES